MGRRARYRSFTSNAHRVARRTFSVFRMCGIGARSGTTSHMGKQGPVTVGGRVEGYWSRTILRRRSNLARPYSCLLIFFTCLRRPRHRPHIGLVMAVPRRVRRTAPHLSSERVGMWLKRRGSCSWQLLPPWPHRHICGPARQAPGRGPHPATALTQLLGISPKTPTA